MLVHQDRGDLPAPIDARIYSGRAARVQPPADPLTYPYGIEHRDLAELERVATLLPGKPVTLLHPDDLISEGAQAHIVGKIRAARVDGEHIVVEFEVTDPAGRAAIDDGIHELSLGYTCRLDGDRYQRDTVVDHLALVPRARCGESCALRADRADQASPTSVQACPCTTHAARYPSPVAMSMPGMNIDEKLNAESRNAIPAGRFAVPGRRALPLEDATHVDDAMARFGQEHFTGPAEKKAAYHHIVARAHELGIDPAGFEKKYARLDTKDNTMDEIQKKLDAALAEVESQKKRADKIESERDEARRDLKAAEKARTDAQDAEAKTLEKARQDAASDMDARVTARVELVTNANAVLGAADKTGKAFDRTKMSDHDIKVEIVKHVDSDDLKDEKRADYVQAAYEGAVKRHKRASGSHNDAVNAIARSRRDALDNTNQPTNKFAGADAEQRARLSMINSAGN